MKLNVKFIDQNSIFTGVRESNENIGVNFGSVQPVTESNYNNLINKPQINSVTLEGNVPLEELGLRGIYYDLTYNWNNKRDLIAEKGYVYIYSDHQTIDDAQGRHIPVAGIKIGDGTSYLIDMPFTTDAVSASITSHINNRQVHVSDSDRQFWDNKVSAFMDRLFNENLVLSKDMYEYNGTIVSR